MSEQDDTIRRLRDLISRQEKRGKPAVAPAKASAINPPAPATPASPASESAPSDAAATPAQQTPSHVPVVFRRDLPSMPPSDNWCHALPAVPDVGLQEALGGAEVERGDGSKFYEVRQIVRLMGGGWESLCEQFERVCGRGGMDAWGMADQPIDGPGDLAFLDLETTGLGGCMIFLAGLMTWDADTLVVRQLLARDYAEEPAVLAALHEALAGKRVLVSFNGKSFDWPTCCVRAAATGVGWCDQPPHLDLLHTSRRMLRGRTPDCKLQTLERHLCRRFRTDDIPGAAIPDAYHAFVRSGKAGQLAIIIKHNRLDLMTLADLMVRLSDLEA